MFSCYVEMCHCHYFLAVGTITSAIAVAVSKVNAADFVLLIIMLLVVLVGK